MLTSTRMLAVLCAASLVVLLASTGAQAAPITVNLRVEGSTTTLYEGPITAEARTIEAPEYISKGTFGPTKPHPCDVNENGEFPAGTYGAPYGSPTSALYDAAQSLGLTFDAYWYPSFNDFFVNGIGSEETEDWGYVVDYTTANVGGCQFRLAPGSEVLWSATFAAAKHLLELSGSATANVGSPFAVHVVDGQTGAPIAGAAIGEDVAGVTTTIPGSPLTNAEGNATITLAHAGTVKVKATQPESVRSNAVSVCVHNGNDGNCGTTLPGAPNANTGPPIVHVTPAVDDTATVGGVNDGHHYSRHKGPRILRGLVQVPTGGTLREVRISLQRRNGKRCTVFSGTREVFVRARCGATRFFSVGGSESFSYLLPASLPKGRYVYDIEAIDDAGVATKLVPGASHVVFYVK
jgi:hypothetical protein